MKEEDLEGRLIITFSQAHKYISNMGVVHPPPPPNKLKSWDQYKNFFECCAKFSLAVYEILAVIQTYFQYLHPVTLLQHKRLCFLA